MNSKKIFYKKLKLNLKMSSFEENPNCLLSPDYEPMFLQISDQENTNGNSCFPEKNELESFCATHSDGVLQLRRNLSTENYYGFQRTEENNRFEQENQIIFGLREEKIESDFKKKENSFQKEISNIQQTKNEEKIEEKETINRVLGKKRRNPLKEEQEKEERDREEKNEGKKKEGKEKKKRGPPSHNKGKIHSNESEDNMIKKFRTYLINYSARKWLNTFPNSSMPIDEDKNDIHESEDKDNDEYAYKKKDNFKTLKKIDHKLASNITKAFNLKQLDLTLEEIFKQKNEFKKGYKNINPNSNKELIDLINNEENRNNDLEMRLMKAKLSLTLREFLEIFCTGNVKKELINKFLLYAKVNEINTDWILKVSKGFRYKHNFYEKLRKDLPEKNEEYFTKMEGLCDGFEEWIKNRKTRKTKKEMKDRNNLVN